jgi:hypothetical protein
VIYNLGGAMFKKYFTIKVKNKETGSTFIHERLSESEVDNIRFVPTLEVEVLEEKIEKNNEE